MRGLPCMLRANTRPSGFLIVRENDAVLASYQLQTRRHQNTTLLLFPQCPAFSRLKVIRLSSGVEPASGGWKQSKLNEWTRLPQDKVVLPCLCGTGDLSYSMYDILLHGVCESAVGYQLASRLMFEVSQLRLRGL